MRYQTLIRGQVQLKSTDVLSGQTMCLTWRGGLHLGSLVLLVVCKDLRGRVFAALNFTLKGVQTLDVLLLQRAGSTAGHAHVQGGGQITPFLILIHLLDTKSLN